jgi:hypothetical protein
MFIYMWMIVIVRIRNEIDCFSKKRSQRRSRNQEEDPSSLKGSKILWLVVFGWVLARNRLGRPCLLRLSLLPGKPTIQYLLCELNLLCRGKDSAMKERRNMIRRLSDHIDLHSGMWKSTAVRYGTYEVDQLPRIPTGIIVYARGKMGSWPDIL